MLLLYQNSGAGWIEKEEFTFHYASTLSIARRQSVIVENKFTFHYASTLSGRDAAYRES